MSLRSKLCAAATAAALAITLVAVGSPSAAAETISRKGAKTVRITAVAAPAGAMVLSSKITVKKGKKTVAKNKTSYKAKKGKYKVTSTVQYRDPISYQIAAVDLVGSDCRITTVELTSDRTAFRDYDGDGIGYYYGQATVRLTGDCSEVISTSGHRELYQWTTSWSEDPFIKTVEGSPSADHAALVLAASGFTVGDLEWVKGVEMSALPTVRAFSDIKTLKNSRTVTVR
jgi:hypothetical protein